MIELPSQLAVLQPDGLSDLSEPRVGPVLPPVSYVTWSIAAKLVTLPPRWRQRSSHANNIRSAQLSSYCPARATSWRGTVCPARGYAARSTAHGCNPRRQAA